MDKLKNIPNNEVTYNGNSLSEILGDFRSWISYFSKNWKIVLMALIIGAILGICYSFFKKTIYKAELNFVLEEEDTSPMSTYAGIASQFGFNIGSNGGGVFTNDNILELLKSRLLVEKALFTSVVFLPNTKSELLINRYVISNKLSENFDKINSKNFIFPIERKNCNRTQDSLLRLIYDDILKENLRIEKRDIKTDIITVSCETTDELFTKYFVEELVSNVSSFYIKTKTERSRKNVIVLQNRTDSVKIELNRALGGAARLEDAQQNIVMAQAQVGKIKERRNIEILNTVYSELVKNLEISKMSLLRDEPLIQIIDSPILPLEEKKVGKLKGAIIGSLLALIIAISTLLFIKVKNKILAS